MTNTLTIPAGWRKCLFIDATHAMTPNGEIHEIIRILSPVDPDYIEVEGNVIRSTAWDALMIAPVRKKEPASVDGKVVGIEWKEKFGTVWLTVEIPVNIEAPEYYSRVNVTQISEVNG